MTDTADLSPENIERVARELAVRVPGVTDWRDCVPMAQAAIAAMREPTKAMVEVGSWAEGQGGQQADDRVGNAK